MLFTRPADLNDSDVADVLAEAWRVDIDSIEHAPVGFGSHHWVAASGAGRWFVTVDELEARRRDDAETLADVSSRHTAALELARALKDNGLDFVVAPLPTLTGSVVQVFRDSYVAALYPYVEGTRFDWGAFESRDYLMAVLDRIAAIHGASHRVTGIGQIDDLVIPKQDGLMAPCTDAKAPWGPGPYARQAKRLLFDNVEQLQAVLTRYDGLAADVLGQNKTLRYQMSTPGGPG